MLEVSVVEVVMLLVVVAQVEYSVIFLGLCLVLLQYLFVVLVQPVSGLWSWVMGVQEELVLLLRELQDRIVQ